MAFMQNVVRRAADWVDLSWSYVIASLEKAAPHARGALLDVGCGDKPYVAIFQPYVTSYLGIEHEVTFLETDASSRARGPDLFYRGDRLPFPDASFDTVLNVQVLEHCPDPQTLLGEMARVLRPDGRLILSAPFSFRLHEEPHDYFRYTPHGLRIMCAKAGLEITTVIPQGSLWSLVAHKLNTFLAFDVALLQAATQSMGKLGHETSTRTRPRYWTMPVVLPTMFAMSAGARVLDRVAPQANEALSFTIVARHLPPAATAPVPEPPFA
jgi:SAM-dependent methyltransferase